MAFCTKCGQPIVEGQVHICPAQQAEQAQPKPNVKNIVQQKDNRAVGIDSSDSSIGVSINTDKMKDSYNAFKGKIAQAGGGTEEKEDLDFFERNKKIVPDCVCANEGEVPIKQYDVAMLRTRIIFAKAEGRMQVTNKRIIFRAAGRSIFGRVKLHQEFKIDELAGIEFRNKPSFNILKLIFAIIVTSIFSGLGIALSLSGSDGDVVHVFAAIIGVIAIAAWIFVGVIFAKSRAINRYYLLRLVIMAFCSGFAISSGTMRMSFFSSDISFASIVGLMAGLITLVNIFLYSFTPDVVIKIKTKGALPGVDIAKETPVGLLSFLFGRRGDENSGFIEVLPWTDTEKAIKELGTMIDDIQTLGDAAIEKWKQ